jgi:Holliday junction DNA helicase RuvA
MISRLTGRIVEKSPQVVVLDVGGVGYRVHVPLSTYTALPPEGADATLRTHTHVREDALSLFGFCTPDELALFERLIEIAGIGPKLGLAILSGLPAGDLIAAIAEGDSARLRAIPGVGPRTAERVVLELKDRLRGLGAVPSGRTASRATTGSLGRDAVSALVNLGYKESLAEDVVRRVSSGPAPDPGLADSDRLQDLIKRSLRSLSTREAVAKEA